MLNRYPWWKNLLIVAIVVLAFLYALPNVYRPDPAIQIIGESSAEKIDPAVIDRAADALKKQGIDYFGATVHDNRGLIRLHTQEAQLRAKSAVQRALGDGYIVALNLAATTPQWLRDIGADPMKLGLDLSGGVHFLMQVDTAAAVHTRIETYTEDFKRELRKQQVRGFITLDGRTITGKFNSQKRLDDAVAILNKDFRQLQHKTEHEGDDYVLTATLSPKEITQIGDNAVEQNLTTLRNRVNELGVSEPLVQRQGRDRIVVELPGIQDTATAKSVLGKTANLEFRLEARPDEPASLKEKFEFRDQSAGERSAWLERRIVITGDSVTNARASFDQNGMPEVNITLDSSGGTRMNAATRNNINRRLGVLFIERKSRTVGYRKTEDGREVPIRENYTTKKIISLATIQAALGTQFRITGLQSPREASELALLLRAGALAAPIDFVEERTVGPSLGAENIAQGVTSVEIGLVVVLLFMLVIYKVFGFAADVALLLNLVLLVACMSILSATLTMPGIAGIVLTLGMAVDANVLIFARVKEELKNRMSPQQAINAGFDRAFVTILDANLTTLIVAVILYAIGSGPVKGFAVTLSIGIITSMFTAIMVTRAIINVIYGGRTVKKLLV